MTRKQDFSERAYQAFLVSIGEGAQTTRTQKEKNDAAAALGRKGGKATASNRTAEQRKEAAKKAVSARWEKSKAAKAK
jgi:hypothetical protein